jgi:hypothetical protein
MGRHSAPRHMHATARQGRSRRYLVAAAAAAALAASVSVLPATLANAAGLLPTTTTVTASPSSATVGTPVTLTATVSALGLPGLAVLPTGSVTFTSTDGTTTTPVGTAPIGSCLLTSCTASITTAALPAGTTSVTGTYSGDGTSAPSSGSTPVTITSPTTTGSSSTVTCAAGALCDTGTVVSTETKTTLDVVSSPSASSQTVSAQLEGGKTLHCPSDTDNQVGALATFDSTASDSVKTVTYTGKTNTGQAMKNNYLAHPAYVGCFGSPTPFMGYINGVYTNARPVAEPFGTFYEAQVSNCANNGGQLPCFTNIQGSNYDTYQVKAPAGDPKLTG